MEDDDPFVESVNNSNYSKSSDKNLKSVQSDNTDPLDIGYEPDTSMISEDRDLMIQTQLYPINANHIPIEFELNNVNSEEDTYLLPLPSLQPVKANCMDIAYEPNHSDSEGRDLMILEPLKSVNPDQIQIDFQPNKGNIDVENNLKVLQPLQSINANSRQKDFESSKSDNNFSHDDEVNDSTWEPLRSSTESEKDIPENHLLEEVDNIVEPNSYSCKKAYKKTYCAFCESYVISRHFSRHLQQRHKEKSMVKLLVNAKSKSICGFVILLLYTYILFLLLGSMEKKSMIMTIRNKGNLKLNKRSGTIIPKKCMKIFSEKINDSNYMICAKCKGYFRSTYIVRHSQNCFANRIDQKHDAHPKVESYILSLQEDYQNYIKCDPLRKELVKRLRYVTLFYILLFLSSQEAFLNFRNLLQKPIPSSHFVTKLSPLRDDL